MITVNWNVYYFSLPEILGSWVITSVLVNIFVFISSKFFCISYLRGIRAQNFMEQIVKWQAWTVFKIFLQTI